MCPLSKSLLFLLISTSGIVYKHCKHKEQPYIHQQIRSGRPEGRCMCKGQREKEQHQVKSSKHLRGKCELHKPSVTKIVGNRNAKQHSRLPFKTKSSAKPHLFLLFGDDPNYNINIPINLATGNQERKYISPFCDESKCHTSIFVYLAKGNQRQPTFHLHRHIPFDLAPPFRDKSNC